MDIYEIRYRNLMRLLETHRARDLAELAGSDPAYISQIKTRRVPRGRDNPARVGDRLARALEKGLGKSQGWMDVDHVRTSEADLVGTVSVRRVPVVGTTVGGPQREWMDMGYPRQWGKQYAELAVPDAKAYLLRVVGDAMHPVIREGHYVLACPGGEAEPGDEVVVRLKSGDMLLRLFAARRDGMLTLESYHDQVGTRVVHESDVEFMHPVDCVVRPRAIRKQWEDT